MDAEDKLALVRSLCGLKESVAPDGLLLSYLALAKEMILTRRNPFSDNPTGEAWEARYDAVQCQLANDLLARRGAEGEVTHTENGISRQWNNGGFTPEVLQHVVPKAKAI